jgi:hypothetical protein
MLERAGACGGRGRWIQLSFFYLELQNTFSRRSILVKWDTRALSCNKATRNKKHEEREPKAASNLSGGIPQGSQHSETDLLLVHSLASSLL